MNGSNIKTDREAPLSGIEPLSKTKDLSQFDCGKHESLNLWLKRFALQNQNSETARTYVVHRSNVVVAYYSISVGSVARESAPERIARGLAAHPVPVSLIARLAIDEREQGKGLGKALLKDALSRIAHAADIVGIRAVLVHAIDGDAAAFYKKFGFKESPIDKLHLMLLIKDLRASLQS